MTGPLVGALDQGTTSSRFMIFDRAGKVVSVAQEEHTQIFPKPGWVEHDPIEIIDKVRRVIGAALHAAGIEASGLSAVGVTNQRETTVLWDRKTGQPVYNAIVWQDTRTAELCRRLAGSEGIDRFRSVTGLPLATYFSGPKIAWLLENEPDLRVRAEQGELCFGTIDSWVVWNLTGGRHVTDVTNASRTMLMDLRALRWSDEICGVLGIPSTLLPEIVPSSARIAQGIDELDGVPVSGMLGDQHAALFGQTCFEAGSAKNTYGTGCFMLVNTGTEVVASRSGLLTTVAYRIGNEHPIYALEGSIAVTGSLIQWLRDNLGVITDSGEVEACEDGRRQRRRLFRPCLQRALRSTLAVGCPGGNRGFDPLRQQGTHCPGGARSNGVPNPRGAPGDAGRFRCGIERAASGWGDGPQRTSHGVPGRHPGDTCH